jgi:hypothetical protein
MNRTRQTVSLMQASQANPGLARLMDLQRESTQRLKAITGLIPINLRASVQAGPFDDGNWCLLLTNTTTAAKLRQLLPALEAHLRVVGMEVKGIRLKVQRVP